MTATTQFSPIRHTLLNIVQGIELLLVGAIGVPALVAERIEPPALVIGLSLLALPSLLRFLLSGRLIAPTLALWPLLLLLGLCALTIRVTPAWEATWPELARMVWGIALCLAVINWINPWPGDTEVRSGQWRQLPPRLIWATLAFLGVGLALTTVGLLVMGPTHKIAQLDAWLALLPQSQIDGFSGFNPNRVAGVAVLLAPLALALALGPLPPRRPSPATWMMWLLIKGVTGGLTLFFSIALLLTQSRSAWLAFGCALVVILSLLGRRGWFMLALLALLVAGTLTAIGPTQLLQAVTVYDPTQITADALIQDRNVAGRLILWQRALHGLADAPLTGMGLGAFAAVSQQPYPPLPAFKPDPDMSHVHNIVLQVGLDFGVPGMIAFVGLLAIMGTLVIDLVRRTRAPSSFHTWSLGLLGSLVAYLVYNLLDTITLGARPAMIVWLLFGLCLGAGEWAQVTFTLSRQPKPQIRPQPAPVIPIPLLQPAVQPIAQPATQEGWEERAWAATAGPQKQ